MPELVLATVGGPELRCTAADSSDCFGFFPLNPFWLESPNVLDPLLFSCLGRPGTLLDIQPRLPILPLGLARRRWALTLAVFLLLACCLPHSGLRGHHGAVALHLVPDTSTRIQTLISGTLTFFLDFFPQSAVPDLGPHQD